MKKETLSKKLFDMLGDTIVSERTMGEYVKESVLLNLPEEESELDEYLKPHIGILKSIDGQIRNNVAIQIKEFQAKPIVKEAESKDTKEPKESQKPAYMTQMEESLKLMSETVQALQNDAKKKADAEARNHLIGGAKELLKMEGATDDVVLKYTQALLSLSDEMTSQDLAGQWKTAYNEMYAEIKGKGYEPMGTGLSNPNGGKEALLGFKERMIKEGKLPSPTNLPNGEA